MTEQNQRAWVAAEAKSWLGTSFVDCARVKGAGVDCAQFVAGVFEKATGRAINIEPYSPQWLLHHSEELFIRGLEGQGCVEIAESAVQPGDIVLYRVGRCYSHAAIILEWPKQIIHAVKQQGGVVYSDPIRDRALRRPHKFFSFWKDGVLA